MPQYAPVRELSGLNGVNGFQINGEAGGDMSGLPVASAGDINGDGFDDLIIGARYADPSGVSSGASYVVFGKASGFSAILELANLNGANGFQINGEAAGDQSGVSVASAGDINGDGFDDLIIGARSADPNGVSSGASYVVFGKASGFGANLQLSSLNGANGFQINGKAAGDQSGHAVSSAGDVNGDGFDDLIIGAWYADANGVNSGGAYVVFGKASGFGATLELSALTGANGFQINGEEAADNSCNAVASAGDINGDGFDDIIVGARLADGGVGASYVVFGKASGFAATVGLSALTGSNGFKIVGEAASDFSGYSVASAGDINGDGLADMVVGAWLADPNGANSGASYVVFGQTSGFGPTLQLSTLNGITGFQINGEAAGDGSGHIASAGDFNGDGFDDLIVGSPLADPNGSGSGATYIVFGKASGFSATLNLSSLDGNNGFQINGEASSDYSGGSVVGAGDLNGDGFDDLIIGAAGADYNGLSSGQTYVIFGGMPGEAVTRSGTFLANTIHGGNFNDTLNGLAGADTLIGYNGRDTLNGGAGADVMRGGGGNDVYIVDNVGDVTTETSAADGMDLVSSSVTRKLGLNIENLTLTGTGAIDGAGNGLGNILRGNAGANVLFGLKGADTLSGNGGNDTLSGGIGRDTLTGGAGADKFVFDAPPALANSDTITDFARGVDKIHLENTGVFTALGAATGTLAAAKFWSNTTGNAHDADDRVIYNTLTGQLFYDADGSATAQAKVLIATLTGLPALTASDIVVI